MLSPRSLSSTTIRAVVAIFAMIVHLTNAAGGPPGMRALSSNSGDDATSIISMIDPSDEEDVVKFLKSSSPHPVSMLGCAKANNDTELASLISDAQGVGGDGQVRLCPGTIHFHDEIELDDSITLSCSGPRGSCILDGHEATRHFVSQTGGLTFTFIDLVLINGLADGSSTPSPSGGSLLFVGSTNIIDGSLFYNNRAISTSSNLNAVSIIFIWIHVKFHACQSIAILTCYHCTFYLFSLVVQFLQVTVKLWWTTAYSLKMLQ